MLDSPILDGVYYVNECHVVDLLSEKEHQSAPQNVPGVVKTSAGVACSSSQVNLFVSTSTQHIRNLTTVQIIVFPIETSKDICRAPLPASLALAAPASPTNLALGPKDSSHLNRRHGRPLARIRPLPGLGPTDVCGTSRFSA